MSRTYRNCNKNGKPNNYALSHVKISRHTGHYDDRDEDFLNYLVREKHPGDHTVPKAHTKMLNRAQRAKDKHKLEKALRNDCFGDWRNDKWFKDAQYHYW